MSAPRLAPQDDNFDFLHEAAAKKNSLDALKMIVEEIGVPVDVLHSTFKTRAIYFAAQSGDLANVRYLIEEARVSLDAADDRRNLLSWAFANPDSSVIDYVTDPKYQFQKQFNDGTTRLMMAIVGKRMQEIRVILGEEFEQVAQENMRGQSILFFAGMVEDSAINEMLIEYLPDTKDLEKDPQYIRGQINRFACDSPQGGIDTLLQINLKMLECFEKLKVQTKLNESESRAYSNVLYALGDLYRLKGDFESAKTYLLRQIEYLLSLSFGWEDRFAIIENLQEKLSSNMAEQSLVCAAKEWGLQIAPLCKADLILNVLQMIARQSGMKNTSDEFLDELYRKLSTHLESYRDEYDREERLHPEKYQPYIVKDKEDRNQGFKLLEAIARTFNRTVVLFEEVSNQSIVKVVKQEAQQSIIYFGFTVEAGFCLLERQDGDHFLIDVVVEEAPIDSFNSRMLAMSNLRISMSYLSRTSLWSVSPSGEMREEKEKKEKKEEKEEKEEKEQKSPMR